MIRKKDVYWINGTMKRRVFCDMKRVKGECVETCNNCQSNVKVVPQPTPQPAPQPIRAPKSCVNNSKFRLNDQKKKHCAYIMLKEPRRQKLCQQLHVRNACPTSCGVGGCWADSVKFRFRNNNDKKKGCNWINGTMKRRVFGDRKRVTGECVETCNNCQSNVKVVPAMENNFNNSTHYTNGRKPAIQLIKVSSN